MRLVLASSNPGKLREIGALLAPLSIELMPQAQLGIGEADEPHATFLENALAKARHASRACTRPATQGARAAARSGTLETTKKFF